MTVTPKPARQPGILHLPSSIPQPAPVTPQPKIDQEESKQVAAEGPTTGFVSQATTWASIAQIMGSSPSRTIDLHPENKSVAAAPRLRPIGRIPSIAESREEPQVEQSRLVFLLGLPQNITLEDVSDAVREGPLVSKNQAFEVDRYILIRR